MNLATHPNPTDIEYYLCGPPAMVQAALGMLAADCPDFCGRRPKKWDCPLRHRKIPYRPLAGVNVDASQIAFDEF
jgi:hypothetical protein